MTQENQNQSQNQQAPQGQKAITDPKQIALLMMSKANAINEAKDDLTMTIRSLMDSSNQIVQAYAAQVVAAEDGQKKVQQLNATVTNQQAQINELLQKYEPASLEKAEVSADGK